MKKHKNCKKGLALPVLAGLLVLAFLTIRCWWAATAAVPQPPSASATGKPSSRWVYKPLENEFKFARESCPGEVRWALKPAETFRTGWLANYSSKKVSWTEPEAPYSTAFCPQVFGYNLIQWVPVGEMVTESAEQ